MSLYEKINEDIKQSMKDKNKLRLSVLRMMKSKVMQVNARGDMDDKEIQKIFNSYGKNLKETIQQSKELGKDDKAAEAEEELAIVSEFLPQVLSDEKTEDLIKSIIEESGASSKKDMGKVMKGIMTSGQTVDGKLAKSIVDRLLS